MEPSTRVSPQTVVFDFEPELPKLESLDNENFFVEVFKKYFPDITAIIDWPCLSAIPFIYMIKENIEPIKLYTMIAAVAITSISIIALTFISIPALSQIFFIAAIASGSVSTLLGGGFIKRYLHQKRMEEQNTVLKNYQSAYQDACRSHVQQLRDQEELQQNRILDLGETNERFNETNTALKKNNKDLTSCITAFSREKTILTKSLQENQLAADALSEKQRTQIETLSTRISLLHSEIENLGSSITTLEDERQKITEERQKLRVENEKLTRAVSDLELSKAQIVAVSQKVKMQVEELSKTNQEISQQITEHKKTIKETNSLYEQLKESDGHLTESLALSQKLRSTTIPEYERKIKELEASIQESLGLLHQYKDLIQETENILNKHKADSQDINKEISDKTERLAAIRANLEQENDKLRETRNDIAIEAEKLKGITKKLHQEVDRLARLENSSLSV